MTQHVLNDTTLHHSISTAHVTWRHALGGEAACLGRLIVSLTTPTAAVVLSEIAQNPDALGISGDFPAAATAAWAVLAPHHPNFSPAEASWYAHHGPFSSYDPTGPETLTQVTLTYDGARFHGGLSGHRLLPEQQTRQLIETWQLEPVHVALDRLERL
ncbi:hypothetical protein [Streptomyces sp. NPDC058475]|uniref:hypothetical protein n=1 Tax=unclassified Streptomyces TaxID=2593676 RepID=UPI00366A20C1